MALGAPGEGAGNTVAVTFPTPPPAVPAGVGPAVTAFMVDGAVGWGSLEVTVLPVTA